MIEVIVTFGIIDPETGAAIATERITTAGWQHKIGNGPWMPGAYIRDVSWKNRKINGKARNN